MQSEGKTKKREDNPRRKPKTAEDKYLSPCWAILRASWDHFGASLAILNDFEALLDHF